MLPAVGTMAQDSWVKIGTNMQYGESFTFSAEPCVGDTLLVDFGDGNQVKKGTKTYWGANANIQGKLLGDTVRIYGALKSLEVNEDAANSMAFYGQKTLKRLNASKNELTYEGTDLGGLDSLTHLDLSDNQISMLNLMAFEQLESFSINNNPTLSTVVFADNNVLSSIHMDNCDIVHFYEKSMPKLNYLSIQNGDMMDITIGDYYPKLNNLDLSGNTGIAEIDVSGCPELEELHMSYTMVESLNLVKNPRLRSLSVDHTRLTKLSLENNTALQNVNVSNTAIKKLDVSKIKMLRNITIDSTDIARLDLTGKIYLANVSAKNNKIKFLDMHDEIGYNGLKRLDLRNNARMTAQTLNFTFAAMPSHVSGSLWTNVFIEGIPGAETSNTALITEDTDNNYMVDVTGDNTASMAPVALTIATADNGSVALTQMGEDFQTWNTVTTTAKPGYPISVAATLAAGYKLGGIEVNGTLVEDTIFVVSAAATVKPVFVRASAPTITLEVLWGEPQQYFLAADEDDTQITIDWGDGQPVAYTIGKSATSIANEDGTSGETVTISGNVTYADFSSYPFVGNENGITGIGVSNNGSLRTLKTYMNEIGTLDVSNQPDLEFLDCSYCDLEELNVADCPKLTTLNAYGNYISSIDLSNQKDLVNIDLKGNMISEMHLGACDKVEKLSLQGNSFTAIDVTGMPLLKELNVALNQLTELNTSNNSQIEVLSANGNQLTKLDLSNNPKLRSLLLNGNKLAGLDLRNQKELSLIYVSDNGWDACTLNDFYYSLNERKEVQSSYGTGNTLWVADDNATNNNDAEHSETTIATAKGWRVNSDGDGSGCNQAYVTILDTENGTVRLFTNDNNEVRSGDKVEKNSVLTLQATPDEGYELSAAKANGRSIADNKFTVIRATDVMVKFTVATSVSGVAGGNVTVESGNHELIFTAATETEAAIYTLDGSQVFCGNVAGKYAVSLPAGIYAVKIGTTTKKIMVK